MKFTKNNKKTEKTNLTVSYLVPSCSEILLSKLNLFKVWITFSFRALLNTQFILIYESPVVFAVYKGYPFLCNHVYQHKQFYFFF